MAFGQDLIAFGQDCKSIPPCKILQFKYWLYAKVLKETENEETWLFCQIFVIDGILIEGAWAPWATLLATSMILK